MADVLHRARVACRVADDPWMLAEHHRIRDEVFVREQGLFRGSDRDGRDDEAATIKVLGFRDQVPGGAVRLYPLDDAGHWQGDRARYRGERKNLFDLRRTAVVHNLHVIARSPALANVA